MIGWSCDGPPKGDAEFVVEVVEVDVTECPTSSLTTRGLTSETSALMRALRGDEQVGANDGLGDDVDVADVRSGRPGRNDLAT